jgi:fucose permease
MVVGYILGIILIPKYISQKTALIWSSIFGLLFIVLATMIPSESSTRFAFIDLQTLKGITMILPYSVLFITLLGFANALVWPAVWPLAIHDLGRFIKTGSALLIMGIAGGALLPLVWGYLADISGSQQAYWIGIPCYLFILYFAVAGHKVRYWNKSH